MITLLEALQRASANLDYSVGLCGNLFDTELHLAEAEFKPLRALWPKLSGNIHYPVPHCTLPADTAYHSCLLYEDEYGTLRLELLNWCIAELQRRNELLAKLIYVRDNLDTDMGLCNNIGSIHLAGTFERLYRSWPKHSGDKMYPVPSQDYSPREAYLYLPKYTGEYGVLRLELLDWCIKELRK